MLYTWAAGSQPQNPNFSNAPFHGAWEAGETTPPFVCKELLSHSSSWWAVTATLRNGLGEEQPRLHMPSKEVQGSSEVTAVVFPYYTQTIRLGITLLFETRPHRLKSPLYPFLGWEFKQIS